MKNNELSAWFETRLKHVNVEEDTRAYIVGLFLEMSVSSAGDMSNESIVLAYANAIETGDFCLFKRCADWILWAGVHVPTNFESFELASNIGMKSYASCDRIMMHKWPVFKQLSSQLPEIIGNTRRKLFL